MPTGVYSRVPVPIADRIWKYVTKSDGCWSWSGATGRHGRGQIRECKCDGGRLRLATHAMWMITHGAYPSGNLLHSCDNPNCVNPAHLREGTQAENLDEMAKKGRSSRTLTNAQVRDIRSRAAAGETTWAIAKDFPVTDPAIIQIVRRITYKHVQ